MVDNENVPCISCLIYANDKWPYREVGQLCIDLLEEVLKRCAEGRRGRGGKGGKGGRW